MVPYTKNVRILLKKVYFRCTKLEMPIFCDTLYIELECLSALLVGKIKYMVCKDLYAPCAWEIYYIWLNEWGMIYHDDMNLVISWRNRNVVTIQTCLDLVHKKWPIGFYTYGSFIIYSWMDWNAPRESVQGHPIVD